jgi:hypothetical protein
MALFPSSSTLKASFDPNGSKKASSAKYWISAPIEAPKKIELYSTEFYAACTLGGILGKSDS